MIATHLLTPAVCALVDLAIEEDLGRGDVTSASVLDGDGGPAKAVVLAKEPMVVFGLAVAAHVFRRVDPSVTFEAHVSDGAWLPDRTTVATVRGPAASLLSGERTALNFLQRLSGVATGARRFAEAVKGTQLRVVDTRKTTPGWRSLEKAAVAAGGLANHRHDLASGILIKDNHVAACGGVRPAVERARARAPHTLRVEVEVTNLAQLDEALAAKADIVLLDNMDHATMVEATKRAHARDVLVEVSGGITLETVATVVSTGADLVSSGAITHGARAVDLSLELGQ